MKPIEEVKVPTAHQESGELVTGLVSLQFQSCPDREVPSDFEGRSSGGAAEVGGEHVNVSDRAERCAQPAEFGACVVDPDWIEGVSKSLEIRPEPPRCDAGLMDVVGSGVRWIEPQPVVVVQETTQT